MQDSVHFAGDGRPVGIVVVDEEPVVRMTTADILTDAGYRVDEAGNAQDALALLELRPDVRVLVTDVSMPGLLDGMALSRIVDLRWPGIRVIVSSGCARPAPGELPRRSRFLAKPYPASALLALVRDLLNPSAEAARGFDAVFIDPLYRPAAAPITVAPPAAAPSARPAGVAVPPQPLRPLAGLGEEADPARQPKKA